MTLSIKVHDKITDTTHDTVQNLYFKNGIVDEITYKILNDDTHGEIIVWRDIEDVDLLISIQE